jgi:hypothetical protein
MAAASAYALGCSTEDEILFGGPEACIAGRCTGNSTTSTASGGSDCMGGDPDAGCAVSFKTDIYDALLSEAGKARCADAQCHGDAADPGGDFYFPPKDAAAARTALLSYQLDNPAGPYVTCAAPAMSKLLCNMFLGVGNTNPYGKCGSTMPQLLNPDVGQAVLTQADLELIEDWITCGAPNN